MQTIYVYKTENNTVVARIHGDTNEACEAKLAELGYANNDDFGATYSPAFGAVDGLVDPGEDVIDIECQQDIEG